MLGGNTKVENPTANFKDAWSGSSSATAYGLTTALYRIIFSYGGYNNAFNVANEVKVRTPANNLELSLVDSEVAAEPRPFPQNLRNCCFDDRLHPLHVRQRRLLRCW